VSLRPTTSAHVLDVLTLNVWGLPWPLSRRRRQRFQAITDRIAPRHDDVVGLQEVWGDSHRLLPRLRPHRPHGEGDSGLALAGRHAPVELPRLSPFRRARSTDALASKGLLHATMDVPGVGPLCVLVTHLQAGRHADVRAHQVDEILDAAGHLDGPAVLMGDFNFDDRLRDDHASDARIASAGFVDAAAAVGCHEPTWHPGDAWLPRRGRGQRFDRIYVRSGREVALRPASAEVLDVGVSDHRPLHARLVAERA
jgi:endonuclease/exonuclease/phosphatase family metal-dependent hydrolase